MANSMHEGQPFSEKTILEAALRGVLRADGPSPQDEDLAAHLHHLLLAERIQMSLRLIQLEDTLKQVIVSVVRSQEARHAERSREAVTSQVAPFISEREAARMAGISPKTLADRRRANRVPREQYRQDTRKGKVRYNTLRWRRHLGLEASDDT